MSSANNSPEAAYREASARLGQLQIEESALERRVDQLRGLLQQARPSDRTTEAAKALLDGGTVAEAANYRGELEEAQAQLKVVRRAIELQRGRVTDEKAARDLSLLDAASPAIQEAAQTLAERLVAVGDAADELHELLGALDAEGVARLHRFPGLRLDPLRSSVEASRGNSFLDELERDYGVHLKRSGRDAARKRRHASHLAEQERLKQAGGLVAAGPNGVIEYDVGGKRKKTPQPGARAGRDDYRSAGKWTGI